MAYSRRPTSAEDFLAEAEAPVVELSAVRMPWAELDPNERGHNVFNLRLNDHDLAILRHLASENEDLSMQKVAKRILVPELRRRVGL